MSDMLPFETFEKYFTPFSAHMLEFGGVLYPTLEHAYHVQRFENQDLVEEIKQARSPLKAWAIAQQHKKQQIKDWDEHKLSVMEALFRAKIAQHSDVKSELIASKGKVIVKHQTDPFWGDAMDGSGRNEMGKLWMKLRDEII